MKKTLSVVMLVAATLLTACGGGGGGSSDSGSNSNNSSTNNNTTSSPPTSPPTSPPSQPAPLSNVVPVQVTQAYPGGDNMPYVSVTICAPGTSKCATINNVLLDTGSEGLRLAASAVPTGLLPAVTDSSGNAYAECGGFASGTTWGPLVAADIKLGGEVASNQSVQLVGASTITEPSDCLSLGTGMNTAADLYANGILGVGSFPYDCGPQCASQAISASYYTCSGTSCANAAIPLAAQVQNPVYNFPQDNNGVLVSLEAVPSTGAVTDAGTLTFGIGTQSDNTMTAQNVIAADATYANFNTTYNGKTYSSFLDSGSNYLYFVDSSIPACTGQLAVNGFYCPASTLSLSAVVTSSNGQTSATIPFSVGNASTLFGASSYAAFNNVAANPGFASTSASFDWGLPFFYGKSVFIGIEGRSAQGAGAGPFYAW